MKTKILSILALLLMAATGAWAQQDQPLTLEAMTDGVQVSVSGYGTVPSSMQYDKNGDGKKQVTKGEQYDLNRGETIKFYGSAASYDNVTISCSDDCYVYGNVMSLVDENNFATATELTANRAFCNLFSNNRYLYSHPTKKLVLPATTLTNYCYDSMFSGCTSLTTAPELPATTLTNRCYYSMFSGCISLTTAPELPATNLANYCYYSMFSGCTSLTTAPVLPATNLANYCYYRMFYNCVSLNTVTCLATDISAYGATSDWLDGVDSEGTFFKANNMTSWSTDASGIPDGWTTLGYTVTLTDGSDPSAALSAYTGKTCEVEYTRSFTENKPATVCLPFAYTPNQWSDDKFYTFSGIKMEGSDYVADMTEVTSATLEANTPYLFVASSTDDVYFSGTYAIPASLTAGTTTVGDWTFKGTYSTIEWSAAPSTPTYGFSAQDANDGITQGQFVKVGSYVRIKPMRAYLEYNGSDSQFTNARSLTRAAATTSDDTLPETIGVRLISANGEVTAIGTLHTRTGEVSFDSEAWYTLDGKRLNAKPNTKGIYVNNGKKVVIK